VAEQFRFEQSSEQGTVDGDELAGRIGVVDRAGDDLLAGAGFTEQQNGRPRASRFPNEPAKLFDAGRVPDQDGWRLG
jgi:hypothetical protein